MTMTKKQKTYYLKHDGLRCPYCKSSNIESGALRVGDSTLCADVKCSVCGRTWQDVYGIVDVEGTG
jgi:transposase-like protein